MLISAVTTGQFGRCRYWDARHLVTGK